MSLTRITSGVVSSNAISAEKLANGSIASRQISDGAIERKIRQGKIGDFIANNVIFQYKRHKNNFFFMEELLDDGFTAYRWVTYVKSQYDKFLKREFVKVKRLN